MTDRKGEMERRVFFWGSAIVGFLGIVLAINASLANQGGVGAGLILLASAVAFGAIGHVFLRNRRDD
jgi:drug/metabolite transporter (DMT)-like permease